MPPVGRRKTHATTPGPATKKAKTSPGTTTAEVQTTEEWTNEFRERKPATLAKVLHDPIYHNGDRLVEPEFMTEARTEARKKVAANAGTKLAEDEAAAIYLYSGHCVCYATNARLRNADATIEPFARLLDAALTKLDNVECTVYRGVGVHFRAMKDIFKKDEIIRSRAFTSTSRSSKKALFFSRKHKDPNHQVKDRTLFIIRCKTGKDISKASKFENETEVLIRPGTPFRVVDIGDLGEHMAKDDHTLYMVTLEEVLDA